MFSYCEPNFIEKFLWKSVLLLLFVLFVFVLFLFLFFCFVLFFVFCFIFLFFIFFCSILAKLEMTQNKNRLFGSCLETLEHFPIYLQNYNFL